MLCHIKLYHVIFRTVSDPLYPLHMPLSLCVVDASRRDSRRISLNAATLGKWTSYFCHVMLSFSLCLSLSSSVGSSFSSVLFPLNSNVLQAHATHYLSYLPLLPLPFIPLSLVHPSSPRSRVYTFSSLLYSSSHLSLPYLFLILTSFMCACV